MNKIESIKITWEAGDEPDKMGVVAEATVSYSVGYNNRRLETLSSGGLWGIDASITSPERDKFEEEQLHELKEHLRRFNVDVRGFENIPVDSN